MPTPQNVQNAHVHGLKYDIVVGGKGDKHMVEYKHFNQERAVQCCVE